jgi:hypothetical protein
MRAQKKRPGSPGRVFEIEDDLVPAAAAAISATVSAATITATTATTISAAATATTAAESTTAAATTSAAAAFAGLHGTGFIHRQGAAVDFLAVELRDGRLGLIGCSHFDKTKTAGTTRYAIIDHLHPRDIARLGKEIGQVIFRHAEGQIAHIEFNAHFLLGLLLFPESDLRCH